MQSLLFLRDMMKGLWSGYWEDDCLILSAAISFYAIFSVIPFLFLLFVIWGFFAGSSDTLYGQIAQFAMELVPRIPKEVLEDIRTVVEHRNALGGVGVFFLLWVFDAVFYSIAHSFDRIFGSGWKRRYYRMKLLSFSILLFVGLVLYASVYLTVFASAIRNTGVTILGIHLSRYLAESLSFRSMSYSLMIGVFTAMFLIVPNRKIRFRFGLLGGFICANLWYLAKFAFRWYVTNIAVFNIVYGALGTLIVVVLWIFYSANILLISAEFVSVLQDGWDEKAQRERTGIGEQGTGPPRVLSGRGGEESNPSRVASQEPCP
jgi:membrane protein